MKVLDGEESDADEASCTFLPKPETLSKPCNDHCRLEWVESSRSKCSGVCGQGQQKIIYSCMKIMLQGEKKVRI